MSDRKYTMLMSEPKGSEEDVIARTTRHLAQWSNNRSNGQTPRQPCHPCWAMSTVESALLMWQLPALKAGLSLALSKIDGIHGMLIWDLVSLDANPSFEKTWSQVACFEMGIGWSIINHDKPWQTMGCKLGTMTWDNQVKKTFSWEETKRKRAFGNHLEVYLSCCSTERGRKIGIPHSLGFYKIEIAWLEWSCPSGTSRVFCSHWRWRTVAVQDVELKRGQFRDLDSVSKFPFWGLSTCQMNIYIILCH